ncbi:MAG: hypothetical protein CM15mP109_04510 [Candidatus Dadabacteria bacterium]|nr:MAG: hypothetical protein CM15mP109_04510 [Candidatus Dadabacteria bacterium]
MYFLYSSGLRVSEILQFKMKDYPFKEYTKIIGKGKKERYIIILDVVNEKIKHYLDNLLESETSITLEKNDPLFLKHINGLKKNLSSRDIQRTMKKLINGFEGNYPIHSTPHSLRHSFASHILRGGTDIRAIQELLGHSSLTSTQIYTELNEKNPTRRLMINLIPTQRKKNNYICNALLSEANAASLIASDRVGCA